MIVFKPIIACVCSKMISSHSDWLFIRSINRVVALEQVVEHRTSLAIFKASMSSKLTYGSAFSTTHRFISGHLQHPVSHITHQNLSVLKRACSAIYDISM